MPSISRAAMVVAANNQIHGQFAVGAKKLAPELRIDLSVLSLRDVQELEPTFESLKRSGVQGLIFPGDLLFSANRERIAALALKHRQPTIFMFPYYADAGGLLSYGVSIEALYKDAARTAGKILKGGRPRDIPVERPTKYELVVNLKTARGPSLKIPQSVLLQATEVIE